MKKVLFSVLALMLAAAMLVSFAACGGNDEPETTAAPDETTVEAVDATTAADETTIADETTAADDETTVADETVADETTVEATEATGDVVVPTDKAAIVALYNDATKAAKNAKAKRENESAE